MDIVYLNGEYTPRSEACLSPDDRGFTFGDGVYEYTPIYRGKGLRMAPRIERLRRGLAELQIDYELRDVESIYHELLVRNELSEAPTSAIYFQVTRGAAHRTHAFPPAGVRPTVYAYTTPFRRPSREEWERGLTARIVPDFRWGRADIKTLQLLPNVLAHETAQRAGADEAILVRDGIALEGARSNLFVVFGSTIWTHPTSNQILPGISRELVLELAREEKMDLEERPTPVARLSEASEVFFTGSSTEIRGVVSIDDRPVGTGGVGPVTRTLYAGFTERVREECSAELEPVI